MTIRDVVAWVAFAGSWLLVMGPVYQAALELSQEDELRDKMSSMRDVGKPDRVSAWWWLVPPVHYLRQRRRSREFRATVMNSLSPDVAEALVIYMSKAKGWLYVAGGGLLLAVGATGELVEHYEWSPAIFVLLAVLAALACVGNVVLQMSRGRGFVQSSRTRPANAATPTGPGQDAQ